MNGIHHSKSTPFLWWLGECLTAMLAVVTRNESSVIWIALMSDVFTFLDRILTISLSVRRSSPRVEKLSVMDLLNCVIVDLVGQPGRVTSMNIIAQSLGPARANAYHTFISLSDRSSLYLWIARNSQSVTMVCQVTDQSIQKYHQPQSLTSSRKKHSVLRPLNKLNTSLQHL